MSKYSMHGNRSKNVPQKLTTVLASISLLLLLVYFGVAQIQFDRNYLGHLKRAADANSLELAEKELQVAYSYLQLRALDTVAGRNAGVLDDSTNILYTTPDNEISFHVNNVKAALDDVHNVQSRGDLATPLERSNVLIKLRESLLDNSKSGHSVTCPGGLALFPYNLQLNVMLLATIIALAGAWLFWEDK
ncbi:MAG: hypothetical protein AB7L09_01430 [Nitrospira sp.]